MANKLGKYTVPRDTSENKYAGANDACRGTGTNGCQQNFSDAVDAFVSDAKDAGYNIDLGYSGYVSRGVGEGRQQRLLGQHRLLRMGAWQGDRVGLPDARTVAGEGRRRVDYLEHSEIRPDVRERQGRQQED